MAEAVWEIIKAFIPSIILLLLVTLLLMNVMRHK